MEQYERAKQLHGVRVELRLPACERRAEVEVARPRRHTRLVVALALLTARLLLRVLLRRRRPSCGSLALLPFLLVARVRGDLLDAKLVVGVGVR